MALKRKIIIPTIALILISILSTPRIISAQYNTNTVFIDVGHGGHDNGSSHYVYVEDNINLQISRIVEEKLKENRIDVILSRKEDEYLSLSQRTNMANNSGADIFVSIHQNASDSKKANGIETLYIGNNEDFAEIIQKSLIENTNANNREHKKSNLQVLRDNNLPAVLVECGFISNPNEGYKLSTKAYQEKIAAGIVEGILEYLDLDTAVHENTIISNSNYKTALSDVNVMSDRDKNSIVLGTLKKGTKVKVINSKFDWLKIRYNGKIGYVSGVYVK